MDDKKFDSPEKQFQQINAYGLLKKNSLTGQSEIVNTSEDDAQLNPRNGTYKLLHAAQSASRLLQGRKRKLRQPQQSRLNFESKNSLYKNGMHSSIPPGPDGSAKEDGMMPERESRLKQTASESKLKFEKSANKNGKAQRPSYPQAHKNARAFAQTYKPSLFKPKSAASQRLKFETKALSYEEKAGQVPTIPSQPGQSELNFEASSEKRKLRFNKGPNSALTRGALRRFQFENSQVNEALKAPSRPDAGHKTSSRSGQSVLNFESAPERKKLKFSKPFPAGLKQGEGTLPPSTLHTRFRPARIRHISGTVHVEQSAARLQFRASSAVTTANAQSAAATKGPSDKGNPTTGRNAQTYTRYRVRTESWRFGGGEEKPRSKFTDSEKRPSRLKFEEDRIGGKAKPAVELSTKKLRYEDMARDTFAVADERKSTGTGSLLHTALHHETDRTMDNIAQKSENQAVEGVNAERKLASRGARYGLKFGRQWQDGHGERVSHREVRRQNKQLLRDLKEQRYELVHGRPSPAAKRRQAIEGYRKQARARAEQKIGVEATAKLEKILAAVIEKSAAVIRAVAVFVGAPLLGIVLAFILIALLAAALFGSVQNTAITVLTAYTAEATDIEAASSYYTRLEAELDKEIKNVSTDWRWQHIDAFHYDLDDIGHDPFQLMAYLSVKYPGFTFSDVQTELDYIFDERYTLTYYEWSETRGDPPDTYRYYHLDVTLRAKPIEPILLRELAKDTINDLVSWYGVLMETKGAHQAYANPFDIDWSGNVSSLYGYRVDPIGGRELQQHRGLDIAMPRGTPIRAGVTGTVRYVGHDAVMGNYIIIDADGVDHTMKYGHCDEVRVSTGDKVVAGETVIGTVGNTGQSTGPHLHLEILENGEYINPIYSLNYKDKST